MLDTELEPPVWSKMNSSLPYPTWNLSACSVIAIPTWKIFTFGGDAYFRMLIYNVEVIHVFL